MAKPNLYPRWQVLKRPWKPVPGIYYETISVTRVEPLNRRDWVVHYIRYDGAEPHVQSRHQNREEAWAACMENIAYSRKWWERRKREQEADEMI